MLKTEITLQSPQLEQLAATEQGAPDPSSSTAHTNDSLPLQTFHLFPLLPPELRIHILHHALSNCYVIYQRIKNHWSFVDSSIPGGSPSITLHTYIHRLDRHRWMRLMLSCRMAWEVAKNADEKVRKEVGSKEYWIYGRKWDEMVAFYRENGEGGIEEFDSDPEFRW